MKIQQFLIMVMSIALFAGCATVAPKELVNARSAYQLASEGPAAQLVPAELHKAHEALVLAEQSFLKEPKSFKTKDLAYIAQRKAELAESLAAMAADKASKDKADAELQKQQAEIVKQGKQELLDSEKQRSQELLDSEKQRRQDLIVSEQQRRQDLLDSEKRSADTMAAMAVEKASKDKADADLQKQQADITAQGRLDLADSEKRTAVAVAELAKLAAIKEEERGLVVTLSGSVLFLSSKSTLLSLAQTKLDQVVNALLAVRARNLIVEGHTDSQGSEAYNQGLSQRRADAVRDYLVQKGYPADRIQALGKGENRPIADNASPEGRANNRRVEIIIEREVQTSKP